jgi:hypothetical protein
MNPKLKQSLKVISIFVAGLAVGIVLMGYLSVGASKTFVEVFRSNYYAEQISLAADAHSKDKKYDEYVYRRNIVESAAFGNLSVFNEMKTAWSFGFPFASPILDKIASPEGIKKGRKLSYAMDLARLAEATENIGLKDKADKLWAESAKLMGHNDVNRMRSLASKLHEVESDVKATTEKK